MKTFLAQFWKTLHLRFTDMRFIKTITFVDSPFITNSMKVAVLLTNHGDTQTPNSTITTAINCDRNEENERLNSVYIPMAGSLLLWSVRFQTVCWI